MSKFAVPFEKRTEQFFKRNFGSIAQLVQSVCLTSRGSGVRLPLLPQKIGLEFHSRPLFFVSDTLRTAQTFQEPDHPPEPPIPNPAPAGCSLRKVRWTVSLFAHDRPDCRRLLAKCSFCNSCVLKAEVVVERFPTIQMFDCRGRYCEYNEFNDLLSGRKDVRGPKGKNFPQGIVGKLVTTDYLCSLVYSSHNGLQQRLHILRCGGDVLRGETFP